MASYRPEDRRRDRRGQACVAAMTLTVVATWLPRLRGPLPGNHLGNVAARYGLHVRNLYEDGLWGSRFSTMWEPYRSEPYAHHPPLRNGFDALVGLAPGEATWQLMLVPVLLGASAVPAGAWLLRTLGFGWRATLLATGAMAATGYFWVYSHVMIDLGPIAALVAGIVLVADGLDGRWAIAGVGSLVALTALLSWPGIAFTVVLIGWLISRRRDPAVAAIAFAAAAGVTLSMLFMVGIDGSRELIDQADARSSAGGYPISTIVRWVAEDARELLPWWYLVVLPLAIVAGIVDRRSRWVTALFTGATAGWVLLLGNGAIVHDYWGYLVLLPGLVGGAALVDRAVRAFDGFNPPSRRLTRGDLVVVAAGAGIIVTFVSIAFGATRTEYIERPADAGQLIDSMRLPDEQRVAWSIGFDFTRVLAYRHDRPAGELTDVELPRLEDAALVFVDLESLPAWFPVVTMPEPVAEQNGYAVVTAGDLREAVSDDPTRR